MTSLLDVPASAPSGARPLEVGPTATRREVRTIVLSAGGAGLAAGGATLHAPALLLLGLTSAAWSLTARRRSTDAALPLAVLWVVAVATGLGLLAAQAGVDLLARPTVTTSAAVLLTIAVLGFALARPTTRTTDRTSPWLVLLPGLPAALALLVGLTKTRDLGHVLSWALAGTDFTQHVLAVGNLQDTGHLTYVGQFYPRAVHHLAALVSAPRLAPPGSSRLLRDDLLLWASLDWLALAALLATVGATARRVALALGTRAVTASLAGTATGVAVLLSYSFFAVFLGMGTAPSLLAVVALLAVPLAVLSCDGASTWSDLRLGLLPLVVLAHVWQPLMLVPALLLLVLAWRALADPGPCWSRQVLLTAAAAAGAAALSLPPVLALGGGGGIAIASIPGGLLPPPWIAVVLGLLALPLTWWRAPSARLVVVAAAGQVVVTAVLMRGSGGFSLTRYYPLKSLWFLTLVLLPVLAAITGLVVDRLLRALWAWTPPASLTPSLVRFTVVAVALTFLGSVPLPRLLVSGSPAWDVLRGGSSPAGVERVDLAERLVAGHPGAVVLPVATGIGRFPDPNADTVTGKLISFLNGQSLTYGSPPTVCRQLAQVSDGRPVVVVTHLHEAYVRNMMAEHGCPGTVVEQIPGGHPDGIELVEDLLRTSPGAS